MLKVVLALALAMSGNFVLAKTVLIDVRTAAEFSEAHLPGAIRIEHDRIASEIAGAGVQLDDRVLLYCRSGRRSSIALEALRAKGYRNVQNLGGMEDAREALRQRGVLAR